jgi:hypothetical protein
MLNRAIIQPARGGSDRGGQIRLATTDVRTHLNVILNAGPQQAMLALDPDHARSLRDALIEAYPPATPVDPSGPTTGPFLVTNLSMGDAVRYPSQAVAEQKAIARAEASGKDQMIWKQDATVAVRKAVVVR